MSTARTTELEATNAILATAGLALATAVPPTGTDGLAAYTALVEARKRVLSRGWNFNTEYKVTYTPDGSDNIAVGTDVISIRPSGGDSGRRLAMRGDDVFDVDENSLTFDAAIELDVVKLLEWVDIPQAARIYVQYLGAQMFLERQYPDSDMLRWVGQEMLRAGAELERVDADSASYNLYNNADVAKVFYRGGNGNSVYLD